MNKFSSGKIYLLHDNTNGNNYIGSTTITEKKRLSNHIGDYRRNHKVSSDKIIKNGNYTFKILEHYPCNNKIELLKREQYWMDKTDKLINIRKAYYSDEEKRELQLQAQRRCDKKRTRDHRPYLKQLRDYKSSWGGDNRTQNNLLLIDVNLFNY